MTQPIKPEDIKIDEKNQVPDIIIEVFNELIIKNYRGSKAVFKRADAIKEIVLKQLNNKYDLNYQQCLDIVNVYREAGWIVDYYKPPYSEVYGAIFTFQKKDQS